MKRAIKENTEAITKNETSEQSNAQKKARNIEGRNQMRDQTIKYKWHASKKIKASDKTKKSKRAIQRKKNKQVFGALPRSQSKTRFLLPGAARRLQPRPRFLIFFA
jgi:hypothetical protein